MPAKTISQRIASKPRKGVEQRTAGRTTVCRIGKQRPAVTPCAPSGFRTVKFRPRAGYTISTKFKKEWQEAGELNSLYNDLVKCYWRYCELKHGHAPMWTPLEQCSSLELAMDKLIANFKDLVQPYQFNIEKEDKGCYFFMLYYACEWPEEFHTIVVKEAIEKLKRKNPYMHDLFIEFLNAFLRTGVNTWFTADMFVDGVEWHLTETLEEYEEGSTERADIQAVIDVYTKGDAYQYAKLIRETSSAPILDILMRIPRGKECSHIKKLIRAGCELISMGRNVMQYEYGHQEGNYDYDNVYLRFENQSIILWDSYDEATEHYSQWIDADAAEGLATAIAWHPVKADCQELFNPVQEWPMKLASFMNLASSLLYQFTKTK